jgi:hypothetical protein
MSTEPNFKWKPGHLREIGVGKLENAFTVDVLVRLGATLPEVTYNYAFVEASDVGAFVATCLAREAASDVALHV